MKPEAETRRRAAALTQLGMDLYERGRYAVALDFCEQAVALTPAFERAHRGRALCLSQLGTTEEAVACARRALALAPQSGLAYSTLGLCLHRTGRREEAEEAFYAALDLTPEDYRVYYNFACYWAEVGNEEKCRRYLALALEVAPETFAGAPPTDPDLARYSGKDWFRELLATLKTRATKY